MLQARMTAEAIRQGGHLRTRRELLDDPDLVEVAQAGIAAGRARATPGRGLFRPGRASLDLKNELLAARATDLRDVGERVLRLVVGEKTDEVEMPAETILIAEDTDPLDTAPDRSRCWGSPRSWAAPPASPSWPGPDLPPGRDGPEP